MNARAHTLIHMYTYVLHIPILALMCILPLAGAKKKNTRTRFGKNRRGRINFIFSVYVPGYFISRSLNGEWRSLDECY